MTKYTWLALGGAAMLLSACGGGGGHGTDVPAVTEAVPAAVATDPAAATTYVAALSAVPESTSNSLEPITNVPDTLATDETGDPTLIPE